ncbi:MAG: hypothetical protein DBY10_05200 [Clostridiales bacterium]|nr:MAG: hypothetical protein DBY10_05200 [Clostridiales bacterium]
MTYNAMIQCFFRWNW